MAEAKTSRGPASRRGALKWMLNSQPVLLGLSFPVFLAVWHLATRFLEIPPYILPSPLEVGPRVYDDAVSGLIGVHLQVTMIEIVCGFVLAAVLGIAIGTLIAMVPIAEKVIMPYVLAFQTVPKVAIAPLLIIWFGFGIQSKIVTAALIAFFPVLVNVVVGLQTVDARRILLMRSLRASPLDIYLKVRLPNMLPYVFAGLESAIVLSAIGAIVAEFIGASHGLGSLILQRQASVDVAGVFSALIYLSLIGIVLSALVRLAAAKFTFWARDGARRR